MEVKVEISEGGDIMIIIFKSIIAFINNLHDFLMKSSNGAGVDFTDKQLHFIVIAIIGMFIYLVVNKVFKAISKYSISVLSFIYTFTVLLVIVFGIEIEQKITKRGNMEFADIVAGVWGFIVVFTVYITIYSLIRLIIKSIKKNRTGKNIKEPGRARHINKENEEEISRPWEV